MKRRYFLPPAVLASLALILPAVPSSADENVFGRCPDRYTPVPFLAFPPADRNENGVICFKATPGNATIIHDDPSGQPFRCNAFPPPSGCPVEATDDLE